DVTRAGSRTITVYLTDGDSDITLKSYAVALEKKFDLFDVVNEHVGHLRVVRNNPDANKLGMKFSTCEWYYKPNEEAEWEMSSSTQLYFLAGESHLTKFADTEFNLMYVALYTANGDRFESCPDVSPAKSGSGSGDNSKIDISVYPNPVAQGGTVRIRQVALLNDDELYAKLYLLDLQGRIVFTGNASELHSGLRMPETPGVYVLVLAGQAGRKEIKIAVQQRDN
ncbi:MAG: T9SS type A sorting domain-containing protein, partial [Prevotellaceae bacterium]|nr:T9SS type A sorting domain-containing protein [Prevotellaceae bacterium]